MNLYKLKVGIIGATGYVGEELMRILYHHPNCDVKFITSKSYVGDKYSNIYHNFYQIYDDECLEQNVEILAEECGVLFFALPHGITSRFITKEILSKTKIIDLGADFRLQNTEVYEKWYTTHYCKDILKKAIYGLCELNREQIKNANIIGNPGCYTTCSIMSLAPLMKTTFIDKSSIIIDACSGVSGAGRSLRIGSHYTETNESFKAYAIANHRHTPEIEQELSILNGNDIVISFTPHLVPMNRGILVTCYVNLCEDVSYEEVKRCYNDFYSNEQFVRILDEGIFPETRWVKGSNYIDINFKIDKRTNRLIVVGAIDNLVKGAAGQAVQNMNIMFGLEENTGLDYVPMFP